MEQKSTITMRSATLEETSIVAETVLSAVHIKNIIFDLCGPIITIDVKLISERLQEMGVAAPDGYWVLHRADLTRQFEANLITPEQFCNEARKVLQCNLSDKQLFDAWNTVITDIPQRHITLLRKLCTRYRLFLLSNSDVVNAQLFHDELNRAAGGPFVEEVFEHAYFSSELQMRKPDPRIFRHIVETHQLKLNETLVIDDCPKHVESARSIGLHAHLLHPGTDITELEMIKDIRY